MTDDHAPQRSKPKIRASARHRRASASQLTLLRSLAAELADEIESLPISAVQATAFINAWKRLKQTR